MTEAQAADLKKIQDSIYRERILRARSQTPEERLADVFAQSASQFGMMLSGAMARLKTNDPDAGWAEVRRWMLRLDKVHDHGRYVADKPAELNGA